jgi:Ca2+-binding EF-hand superfamily protein
MRNQNQTRNSLLLALLATGVLATGTLLAEPADGGKRIHIVKHLDGGMLEMADANGDGNISQAEHDAMRAAHLAELDANNDGFVTYAEHKAAMEARAQKHFIKRHDKDGDGRVSVDEMAEHGDGMFERMDANGDGMVTAEELRQGHRGMRFEREIKEKREPAR